MTTNDLAEDINRDLRDEREEEAEKLLDEYEADRKKAVREWLNENVSIEIEIDTPDDEGEA